HGDRLAVYLRVPGKLGGDVELQVVVRHDCLLSVIAVIAAAPTGSWAGVTMARRYGPRVRHRIHEMPSPRRATGIGNRAARPCPPRAALEHRRPPSSEGIPEARRHLAYPACACSA